MNDLAGRVVLITGASSGIGEALAVALAHEGCRLLLMARREAVLKTLAERIRPQAADVEVYAADVRDPVQCSGAVARALEKWGRLDIVILSAGIGVYQRISEFDAVTCGDLIAVNVNGVINGVGAALPVLRRQKAGMIVGISSIAAHLAYPISAAYAGSKAAVSTFLRGIQIGLKRDGVRVLIVEPGYIRTPMTASNRHMPMLMEADELARRILRAIRRNKGVLRTPWPMYLMVKMIGLWRDVLIRCLKG
jgi:short-subunit dehydrogenase